MMTKHDVTGSQFPHPKVLSRCLSGSVSRRNPFFSTWMAAVGISAGWLCSIGFAQTQRTDSFNGGEPRWILVESDCGAELTEHEISLIMPHSDPACELFEIACRSGSFVNLAYPIEPCNALNEFTPRVWTRCASGRIRLGVRIVFPFAEHPITGGRMHAMLWGEAYSNAGQWQVLQVTGIEQLLQTEMIAIRSRFGGGLKLDGAYIDSLVLNAYTGPGRYRVQVDDMELRGMIPMAATGIPLPRNWREKWQWRYAVPSKEQQYWAAPNRPPVWLKYQGESLPWVSSLGFTGLFLDSLPSEQQLERIRDAELAVVCPPPAYDVTLAEKVAPVIRGWLIGSALDSRSSDQARQVAAKVNEFSEELRRPLIGEALEGFWMFSRIADEVIVPSPALASAGNSRDKQEWLRSSLRSTQSRGNGWVSLAIDDNPVLKQQYRTAKKIIDPVDPDIAFLTSGTPEEIDVPTDPLRFRHDSVAAIIAGARGLLLRSTEPLSMQSSGGSAEVAALRWLNNDLDLWGPWIMAGQRISEPRLSRSDYQGASWTVSQSRLVIAQTQAPGVEHCISPTFQTPLRIELDDNAAGLEQVLRITSGKLERVELEESSPGVSWTVPTPAPTEVFVITSNPEVLAFLRRRIPAMATENASDQLEIVAYNATHALALIEARFPDRDRSEAATVIRRNELRRLEVAQQTLERGWQALRSGQPSAAMQIGYQASDMIQGILYEGFLAATENLASPQSTPFVLSPGLLAYHWRLAEACERSEWLPLPLPGNEFSSLSRLLESGWSQQRRLADQFDLRVELVPGPRLRNASQIGGATGQVKSTGQDESTGALRLAAYSNQVDASSEPIPGGYEGASLRIRSAPARVKAGQLVRISGMAEIIFPPQTSDSGLLVYDNQAGPGLGQLVRGAQGQLVPIELYRFIVNDGELRVLAECRGQCDILLRNVGISVIQPATDRRSYQTGPLTEYPTSIIGETFIPEPLNGK